MLRQSVLPPRPPPSPGLGQPGTPSISLPAAFQGPGTQPWAQLPVHLRQRAQRGTGPLQVWLGPGQGRWSQGWQQGLGRRRLGAGSDNPSPRSPSNRSSRKLSVDEMYLSDTGGQYLCVALSAAPPPSTVQTPIPSPSPQRWVVAEGLKCSAGAALSQFTSPLCRDGTTDITRTMHWGVPTPLQKVPASPTPASIPLRCPASLCGAQHPPVVPSIPLQHSAPKSQPGLDVQEEASGHHHAQPPRHATCRKPTPVC